MFVFEILLWFIIGVILAIIVYINAGDKGMDAGLWALVVLLFGIIGFILYLFFIIRQY